MKVKPFSILNRAEDINTITSQKFDLTIIGGGVTGAGIALDAASRGMKTCLIEKNDFASGTSNKSTKLIHGGLRYLKQLEIGLVRESGRERAIVHKLAPHLVIPEKMLLPLVEGGTYGKMMTSIGLRVYDFLADVEGDDRRKMLDKKETLKKEPLLDAETILGSGYYSEYRTDDARLTVELLKKASEFGATILNYCEMDTFVYNTKKQIKSIDCIDHNSGETINISSRNFVSATGPWVDLLREKNASKNNKYLHLTKGVHLVFPFKKFPLQQSVYFDVADGRMIFAIPRGHATYVGTTDTNYFGNLERVVTTKADINYLLDAVNDAFPDINLTENDIESNWAGLRPLIHEAEKDPSELSRKDEIFISDSGLISIAGGKLTGYRKMAHRVIDAVIDTMTITQAKKFKESYTEKITLTTDAFESSKEVKKYRKKLRLKLEDAGINNNYFATYLTSTYGKQANTIVEHMPVFKNKNPEARLIRAELWYGIHHEMINSLADFFVRRTGRLYFNISSISMFETLIVKDCTKYLNWDAARIKKEKEILSVLVKDATHFYDEELKA
ncbi:glycerol-3-phosphate dehydrogenase/oxidase [Lacinutrix sp. Bg11-31]|uniref:glycerol-3-phosphate dehydrogenase/oxidase n=1 Tax=Lacinutrix sp. Bg11-31 TaxID=2057808 RepID=UPI000C30BEC7|nr:glycerol-3-phosphate dehydrogenase/oxidase [Lacinutrix sp. Bg11-31]AUC81174.1 glycerol-3-phosphate dehydrogenase [Lacinutrix sp. Bg11-31]